MRKMLIAASLALATVFAPPLYAAEDTDRCGIVAVAAGYAARARDAGVTVPQMQEHITYSLMPQAKAAGLTEAEWNYIIAGFNFAYSAPLDAAIPEIVEQAWRSCVASTA